MAFWGVEVKPGKPFTHHFDIKRRKLHISQATLGEGSATQRSVVQCNVGDKSPVLLCALLPDRNESCPLDLEFEEEGEVLFSVLGPRSVHLSGYYLAIDGCGHGHENDDDTDSYGEDIAESDTEQSEDYIDTEEEYDNDFIDDDDLDMFQSSPRRKSAVVIEEIVDDEKPTNGNGSRKRLKKYQMSDSDSGDQKQTVVKDNTDSKILESEDEDGFPISSTTTNKGTAKSTEDGNSEKKKAKESKKKVEDDTDRGTGTKRKIDTVVQDSKAEKSKVSEQTKESSLPSTETAPENDGTPAKKKKLKSKKKNRGFGDDSRGDSRGDIQEANEANLEAVKADKMDQDPVNDEFKEKPEDKSVDNAGDVADGDQSEKKKKRRKKKKSKAKESDENANNDEEEKKDLIVETEEKKDKEKQSKVRTFANGLVIEEVKMGKPDGQKAVPGKKVAVKYIGKLKSNGKIFDSNVSGPPFTFRLGIGRVIPGWDVGVSGMRVGDKRKLTIPPSMGYGAKGAPPKIPQNAWLVFDVELVSVQ